MPSDVQVQQVYNKVLAQLGSNARINGVDIGYAGAEKVVRVHVTNAAPPGDIGEVGLPNEIDGVKIVLVKGSYGPEG